MHPDPVRDVIAVVFVWRDVKQKPFERGAVVVAARPLVLLAHKLVLMRAESPIAAALDFERVGKIISILSWCMVRLN